MGQMDGKIAVVSGWGSPLRTALAERLREEGASVLLADPGERAIAEAGRSVGRIDALVNVQRGNSIITSFFESDCDAMDASLDQVKAFAAGMRVALPFLLRGSDARVVNVCAPQGSTAYFGFTEAVTADFALQGLTRAVGAEWAQQKVLVNCLVPGLVDLPEVAAYRNAQPTLFAKRLKNTALQRLGDARRDVGGALMLLLSDEGCFMVGHVIHADGGQHLATAVYDPGSPGATDMV